LKPQLAADEPKPEKLSITWNKKNRTARFLLNLVIDPSYGIHETPTKHSLSHIFLPHTLSRDNTRNAPPPAASVIIAKYLGFTVQKVESQALFVILMLS
jgi:hypothetical protein